MSKEKLSVVDLLRQTIANCEKAEPGEEAIAVAVVTVHADGTPAIGFTTSSGESGLALLGGVAFMQRCITDSLTGAARSSLNDVLISLFGDGIRDSEREKGDAPEPDVISRQ